MKKCFSLRQRERRGPWGGGLSDTKVYEPQIRAILGTASRFCEACVLQLRTLRQWQMRVPWGGGPFGPSWDKTGT